MNEKKNFSYEPLVTICDGDNYELHLSRRSDGLFIISKCQVLKDGSKMFMRSSIVLSSKVLSDFSQALSEYVEKNV